MSDRIIRIAVDAMGGDNFPGVLIEGSLAALRLCPDVVITLVGDEKLVGDSLEQFISSKKEKHRQP